MLESPKHTLLPDFLELHICILCSYNDISTCRSPLRSSFWLTLSVPWTISLAITSQMCTDMTEPMARNVWILVLFLGLMKTKLNFFHGRADGDEILGTEGQPSVSTQINLTMPQPPWVPEMLFLQLCEEQIPPARLPSAYVKSWASSLTFLSSTPYIFNASRHPVSETSKIHLEPCPFLPPPLLLTCSPAPCCCYCRSLLTGSLDSPLPVYSLLSTKQASSSKNVEWFKPHPTSTLTNDIPSRWD